MSIIFENLGGLPVYRFPGLARFPELAHAVFTRRGGVSSGVFASLNLSYAVGDRPDKVGRNLELARRALGLKGLVGARQVHGRQGLMVTDDSPRLPDAEVPGVDLLLTRETGVGLLIKQADCQAVMLYDPENRVAANVHCGWRGQVQNILAAAVARLKWEFGSRPQHLAAAIGPGLGPCCAEFSNYREEFPPPLWSYQVRSGYFDLWRLSRDQLVQAGVLPGHIEVAGLCTRCRPEDFFSYRRDGATGRQGTIIALRAG
jgi:polyphenol oxidase